jgi:glycosyltransferase involved in cell wall biosynthesis
VKDYARSLAHALNVAGVDVEVVAPPSWSIKRFAYFYNDQLRDKFDICHVQYPSVGHKASFAPHLLGILDRPKSVFVTVHECSALPRSQRCALNLFRLSASSIIFCSDYERAAMNSTFGSLGAAQVVIPMGSNVPSLPPRESIDNTIVYFGQIRRKKGIEQFLELARLSSSHGRIYKYQILGSVTAANEEFALALQNNSPPSVEWSKDLTFDEVANILNRSLAAYMPFPDGASERRGSILAAFANGLPVITREGPATTAKLRGVIMGANNSEEALEAVDLLAGDSVFWRTRSGLVREYARGNLWQDVAARHIELYRNSKVRQTDPRGLPLVSSQPSNVCAKNTRRA